MVRERSLPFGVVNGYPLLPGARRARSADLVIRDAGKIVLVAAQFKYEPSHRRAELLPAKLPVVIWGDDGVAKDVQRIQEFVEQGVARAAFAVFIDRDNVASQRVASAVDFGPAGTVVSRVPSTGQGYYDLHFVMPPP